MTLANLSARIAALERRLGLDNNNYNDTVATATTRTTTTARSDQSSKHQHNELDLAQRLTRLEQRLPSLFANQSSSSSSSAAASASSASSSLLDVWLEAQTLLQTELDPGTALTYQQQIVAPLLYRRQEVLAGAESFQANMDQVSQIVSFLLVSQPPLALSRNQRNRPPPLTLDQVIHAPILTETRVHDEQNQRLDTLWHALGDVTQRADQTTQRVDHMLDQYQTLIAALAERMVRLDELTQRQKLYHV